MKACVAVAILRSNRRVCWAVGCAFAVAGTAMAVSSIQGVHWQLCFLANVRGSVYEKGRCYSLKRSDESAPTVGKVSLRLYAENDTQ